MFKDQLTRRTFLRGMAAGMTGGALVPPALQGRPAEAGAAAALAPATAESYPIAEPGKAVGPQGKLRIVTTTELLPQTLEKLRQMSSRVELHQCRDLAELNARVPDADAVYGNFNRETLGAGKQLKWIQWTAAGVESLRWPELIDGPIVLTNMQRIAAPVISETAIALLLALARGIDRYVRQTDQHLWQRYAEAVEISGTTMGIVGLGGIGSAIAQRAHDGFDMKILATDAKPLPKPAFVAELHAPDWFREMVPRCDVLVSAAPHTPQTEKMFNEPVFRSMKQSAFFINVSRGKLVDTPALVRALNEGWIAGAGLDVAHEEPLPPHDPLWSARRVIITSHASGVSPLGRGRAENLFVENIRRYLGGLPLLNVVDKKRGY